MPRGELVVTAEAERNQLAVAHASDSLMLRSISRQRSLWSCLR